MTGTGSTSFPPINQLTAGDQSPPVTVQLADGRILHVWSECALADDTTAMELQGRIYNADGTPSTDQFSMSRLWAVDGFGGYDWPNLDVDVLKDGKVMLSYVRNTCEPGADAPIFSIIDPSKAPNTTGFYVQSDVNIPATNPSGFESPPVTTVLADGKVLFVWGNDATSLATSHMTLQARVYDPVTNTFGAQTTVSTSIPYSGYNEFDWDNLSVSQLAGGRVVIGYEQSSLLAGGKQPVYGMFDVGSNLGLSTFKAVGPILSSNTSFIESPPVITALNVGGFGDGGFAAVWTKDGFSSSSSNSQVFVRIFDANGNAKTADIQVGSLSVDGSDRFDVNNLTVEKLASGKLVIGFVETDNVDCVSYPAFSIIDPSKQPGTDGFAVKLDVKINTSAKTDFLGPPVIEALSNGNFVAVWANGDGVTNQLVYRVFDANGNPISDQTVITEANNSGVVNYDGFDWANINVVAGANGSFTASWVGYYDGSGTGVYSSGPIRPGDGIVDGTAGADLITPTSGPGGTAYIDAQGDKVDGTVSKADTIKAAGGNDTIEGGAGNDTIFGESGDDRTVLKLGDGADSIIGGEDGQTLGDTIDTRNISSNVTVTFTANEAGRVVSGSNNETDTFREIERFELGAGNDTVDGTVTTDGIWVDAGAGNDLLKGGAGRDTLSAGQGSDTLEGNAGNDSLTGGDGNDQLFGGDDDDTLAGSAGADTLVGGTDNDTADYSASNAAVNVNLQTGVGLGGHAEGDTYNGIDGIIGSSFNDTLVGFDIESRTGDDIFRNILRGGDGDDSIDGRAQGDELYGDAGNDTILGGTGTDSIFGGSGRDSLVAGDGGDTVLGGTGQDTIRGNEGNDSLSGEDGDDTIQVGAGDTGLGGAGDDVFLVDPSLPGAASVTVTGGEAFEENVVDPTNNPGGRIGDVLDLRTVQLVSLVYNKGDVDPTWNGTTSESGTVVYRNAAGELVTLNFSQIEHVLTNRDGIVDGTTGNDDMPIGYVDGQGDQIDGDDGLNDTIRAGAGNDTVDAGQGNDRLEAGEGNDSAFGNAGDDLIDGAAGFDTLSGGAGNDTLESGGDNDSLSGGADRDNLSGGEGADTLDGGEDADTLAGGNGADQLLGGPGADSLSGGAGNDTLSGGTGADTMLGEGGDDRFVLAPVFGSDSIVGGETEEVTGDTLDATGLSTGVTVNLSGPEAGTLADGSGTVTFSEIENILLGGGNDTVTGSGGNDRVDLGGGNDSATGGSGNDTFLGGGGDDTLDGGADNDSLSGGDARDSLVGGAGNDTLAGGTGQDTLTGGDGADSLSGEDGDDTIQVGAGDTGLGGAGDDVFLVDPSLPGAASVTVTGGEAFEENVVDPTNNPGGRIGDVLDLRTVQLVSLVYNKGDVDPTWNGTTSESGTVVYRNAAGELVTLNFSQIEHVLTNRDGIVDGTAGNDDMPIGYVDGQGDQIDGDDGLNDTIRAGAGNDTVDAGQGNDRLEAGEGNDSAFGNAGDDVIDGAAGFDTLSGGAGNDTLDGGGDNDSLSGGADRDNLSGGEGADTLDGGADNDSLSGDAGRDSLAGGGGDDTLSGGGDADTLDGLTGNDALSGDAGDDFMQGGSGTDTLFGGADNDTLEGNADNDSLSGDGGNDSLLGGDGADIADGGEGNDVINTRKAAPALPDAGFPGYVYPGTGVVVPFIPADPTPLDDRDTVFGGGGNDTILTGDDADSIDAGSDNDLVDAGIDNDTVLGGTGDDTLTGGEGRDSIAGGDGNDLINGGDPTVPEGDIPDDQGDPLAANNADTISGGVGNDTIQGGDDGDIVAGDEGNDSVDGGVDNDTVLGGAENDTLEGGQGNDSLDGGTDRDFVYGGTGNDTMRGGLGADVFVAQGADILLDFDALTGIQGTGGATNTDNDFVDLSAFYNDTTLAHWNAANPTQQFLNPLEWLRADQANDGILQNAANLRIENGGAAVIAGQLNGENTGVVCFTAGTRIMTVTGERAIETLEPGDLVLTMDHGYQPIRWIGSTTVEAKGNLAPIVIAAGVLGNSRTLRVSPQHRMLLSGWQAELLYDTSEVLAPAKALVNDQSIRREEGGMVEYFHMLFDVHEIIFAEGAPSESFHPGEQGWGALADEARAEILQLFPMLEEGDFMTYGPSVRRSLKANEAKLAAELLVRATGN